MESKKLAQAYLNGKPLWKCSHSELTKYAKENGLEMKPGLKTYQVGALVKKHLESTGAGLKPESKEQVAKSSQTKEKAVPSVKKADKQDLAREIQAKAGKLGNKNAKSAGFEIGEKVKFVERGTKKEKTGKILKIIYVREQFHAQIKTHDKEQWAAVSKLEKV